jgi:hypothetical protein
MFHRMPLRVVELSLPEHFPLRRLCMALSKSKSLRTIRMHQTQVVDISDLLHLTRAPLVGNLLELGIDFMPALSLTVVKSLLNTFSKLHTFTMPQKLWLDTLVNDYPNIHIKLGALKK